MSQLPNPRQIKSTDFDKDNKKLVDKLAYILNKFMNDTAKVINGNIDFVNLNQEKVSVEMTVNGSGVPIGNSIIQHGLSRVNGIQCIRAQNLTTSANFATSTPFVNFFIGNDGLLRVSKITGLVANEKYRLTLVLFP